MMGMILVVDDDAMTLKLVEHTLTGGGHEVVTTANPDEAALLAAAHQVDAVILDVLMPGRSGFDVLRDLHENDETRKIPVLMLSSLSQAQDRVRGLRGGADEYLGKPFEPEELLLRLNRLIDGDIGRQSEFQGNLETLSFAEIVQSLVHGGANGILEIGAGGRRGRLVFSQGVAISAAWGRLQGEEAALAMMDLRSGTFRFFGRERVPEPDGDGGEIPVQQVMFTAAWLIDEVSRWPEVGEHRRLSVVPSVAEPPRCPEDCRSVPVEEVFRAIEERPGVSIRDLEALERWAPRRIILAVRFLVQRGAVEAVSPMESAVSGAEEGGEGTCGVVIEAVGAVMQERGFSHELPHVLIFLDPSMYAAFLEIRQAVPVENLAASGESMVAAWRGGRVATLALRSGTGGLVLHVVSLQTPAAVKQVRARMADYPAVLVWVGDPERLEELGWVFEWIEDAPTPQWGVLASTETAVIDRAGALLSSKNRWRLHDRPISTMEELLAVIARC